MKRYKLKKDIRRVNKGALFYSSEKGDLTCPYGPVRVEIAHDVFETFPGLLEEYFELIPEQPKTVFDLKEGDNCVLEYGDGFGMLCAKTISFGSSYEAARDAGYIHLTIADYDKELARRKAKVILERDTKGFKPDWEKDNIRYYICYNHYSKQYDIDSDTSFYNYGEICFATKEDAKASIKAHPDEWKTYLGVEE